MNNDPSIGHMMNRAARLLRRLANQKLEPLGLSSGHLPVLTALMGSESMSQKALTECAGIEQPTMAATLARMERDGIIERWPDPHDKRSFRFSLAPAVRDKAGAIKAVIESMNVEALTSLPEKDREEFPEMLRKVILSLGQAVGS